MEPNLRAESICNMIEYNGVGPVVKTNALNCFKDSFEACAVAGGLSRELISHLTFHSNKYTHGKLDHVHGTFVGYKWTSISLSKMY